MEIQNYLLKTQDFSIKIDRKEKSVQDLLNFITHQMKTKYGEDPSWNILFQGEFAFYQGNTELALQKYLQTSSIPYFQFFCYRASAFAAKRIGQSSRAAFLGKRTLDIYPEDYPILKLLAGDLSPWLSKEELTTTHRKLMSLLHPGKDFFSSSSPLSLPKNDELLPRIPLGSKELDELALIFKD